MPKQKKTLTEDECKKKLGEVIDTFVDDKLDHFKETQCYGRKVLTDKMAEDIAHVRERLDSVRANGEPGLENSLKDLYSKNKEIHIDLLSLCSRVDELFVNTEGSRSFRSLIMAFKDFWQKNMFASILKSKLGRLVVFSLIVLAINSLLKHYNVDFDIQDIFKKFGIGQ